MCETTNTNTKPNGDAEPPRPALWRIFVVFFRTGLLTVGGGYSMLPVLHFELVRGRGWLDEKEFSTGISQATTVPGAVAANTAYLFGRVLRGARGSLVAVLGVALPSFLVMLIVAAFLIGYLEQPMVQRFMHGAAAAVTAQLAYGAWLYGRTAVRRTSTVVLAGGLLAVLMFFELHPLIIVAIALAIAPLRNRLSPPRPSVEDDPPISRPDQGDYSQLMD